jgi:hypothetical protein
LIDVTVTTEGEIRDQLYEYSRKFPSVANHMIMSVGAALADFQKEKYLHGVYLDKIPGETYDSVGFFKLKKGVAGVRPGKGVRGHLNFLSVYVRGLGNYPRRDFVNDSAAAFFATRQATDICAKIARKSMIKNFKGAL